MPDSVMPETRTHEIEGVTIEYLTYDTLKSYIVEQALRTAYEKTGEDGKGGVRGEVFAFYKAMPAIVSIMLPDVAPFWGMFLKRMVSSPTWLEDPVKDFRYLESYAPTMTVYHAFNGYQETREKVMDSPDELKEPLQPVDEFDETLTDDEKQAKKKTSSGAGRSSTQRSSPVPAKRSAAPTRAKR